MGNTCKNADLSESQTKIITEVILKSLNTILRKNSIISTRII